MTARAGLLLFLLISVSALMGVFFYTSEVDDLRRITDRVRPGWLRICLVLPPLADWLTAGLRMYLFTSVAAPSVTFLACARNCAVGAFMAAATPSQTGGGVAQTYVLVKEGASVGAGLGILYMTFLSTLVFYCLAVLGLWGLAHSGIAPGVGNSLPFLLAAMMFGGLTFLGIAAIARPDGTLDECADTARGLALHHKRRFAAAVLLSALVFGNKYLAAYFAALSLGLSPPLFDLIVIQVVINVLLYFFPTPGASGGAELSAALLMSALVPAELLGPHTVLWRSATMYLSVLVGGAILMHYLRRESR